MLVSAVGLILVDSLDITPKDVFLPMESIGHMFWFISDVV
jgi:hypothetical protein